MAAPGRLPTFLVAGAQRCGTTTLHLLLKQHPQIRMARPKELHFFDHHWDRGLDWYKLKFRRRRRHTQTGEATPSYLFDPVSRERMIESLPDVRLVIILRDPTKRAYSHYWHSRQQGREQLQSFESAIARETVRLRRRPRRAKLWHSYLARGHYIDQLLAVEAAYGRDRLHVMLLEDLMKDQASSLADLFKFLDVDVDVAEQIKPHWANRIGDSYPPMKKRTQKKLHKHFRKSNARLGEWLGRDLSHWN